MADLLQLYSHMKQDYSQAVHFFGEDPAKMRIDDFFGIFSSFIMDFEVQQQIIIYTATVYYITYCVCMYTEYTLQFF